MDTMIYVDLPEWKKSEKGKKTYSHMTGDSLSELHDFASTIGVKPHFYHRGSKYPHYDITSEQYNVAIKAGAILVSSKVIVEKAKLL